MRIFPVLESLLRSKMQPLSMNDQPVVLAGIVADAALAGLFAVSFEGLVLTNAQGQCLKLNAIASEILGLDTDIAPSTALSLADFLGFKTDQAWVNWQSESPNTTTEQTSQSFRSQTQLTNIQGQTATIPYAVVPQANNHLLWILPPPQLIQWHIEEPLTPSKLTAATYEAILETQTEMVVRFLPDSTFTYVNRAYCEMLGRSREELLGRHFLEVIPPDAQAMMREELQAMNCLTPQHPIRVVINPSITLNGSQIWHEWTNVALFDHTSKIIEFQATGRDITADYNFTRTLKAAKDRIQLAFDIAHMGYCDWDLQTNRLLWSEGYERLMGMAPGTFDNRLETFMDLVHPADRNSVRDCINEIIHTRQQHTIEFRIIKPSGEIAWFLARGSVICDSQGNPVRFTGVDMDITERKQRELELQYQKDLQELLFNESADALFLVNPETVQIIDCNPRAVELFEAESKADLIGLVGHEDLHVNPLTEAEVADNLEQMHAKGFWSMEVEYQTRQGKRFWGNIATKPVSIAGQAFTFVRITDVSRWKQVELDLLSHERRYHAVFNHASLGIAFCEAPDYRISEANPFLQNLLGYCAAELRELTFLDFTHPEDISCEQPLIEECFTGQRDHYQLEKRYVRKDGSIRWVNLFATVIRDADGSIPDAFVFVKDITEQKKVQLQLLNWQPASQATEPHPTTDYDYINALETIETRLKLALETAQMGYWDWDLRTNQVIWSEGLERLMGLEPGTFDQQIETVMNLIHPEDLGAVQAAIQTALATGNTYQAEFRFFKPNGEIRWALGRGKVFYDQAGQPIRLAGIDMDVTAQKEIQLELAASEAKFRSMFTQAAVGIVYGSLSGQILSANQAFADIVGYTPDELQGMSFADLTYPPDLTRESMLVDALMTNEIPNYSIEKRYIRKDGSLVWVSLSINKIYDETGQAVGGIGVVQDINYRKALEQELEASYHKYQTLFEFLPIGLTLFDESGQVKESNPAAADILGISTQTHLKMTHTATNWECYTPDGHRLADQEFPSYRALHHWETVHGEELQVKKPDGSMAWISVTAVPLATLGVGAVIAYIDITDRKQAELELQASEAKFRGIFEQAAFGIAYSNSDGNFQALNPALCDLTGMTESELLKTNFQALTDPTDLPQELDRIAAMVRGEIESYQMEKRIIRADGSLLWVAVLINQLRDPQGHVIGYIGIIQDIDEHKRLQDQLDATRLEYQSLFEHLPIGLNITDNTGLLIEANPAAEVILGIPHAIQTANTYASEIWECFYPDGRPIPTDELPAALALNRNEVVANFEMLVNRPDGSRVCLSVTAAPLPNPELGVAIAFFDITEMKQVEQELETARREYQTLFEVLPIGILITNDHGHIAEVNSVSQTILGLPNSEQIQLDLDSQQWQCFHSDGSVMPSEEYPAVIALRENRIVKGIEVGYQRPDGTLIWLETTAAPIPIPGLGVVLTYFDITNRKLAEQALREKEVMLQLALDAGNQGVFEVDLTSGQITINASYWAMLDYDEDEVQLLTQQASRGLEPGTPWIHPEDLPAVAQGFMDLVNGISNLFEVEYRQRTKAGDWIWFHSTGITVAWDETGKPTQMMGVYHNINDRKQIEQTLRDQETTLRLALEAGNQGVWDVDLQTQALSIDLNYAQMLGYDTVDLHPTLDAWAQSLHPDDLEQTLEHFHDYILGRRVDYQVEFRLPTKSGVWKWILSTGKIVAWDKHGQPTRIIGTHIDIDQRKQAELALARKATQERLFAEISNNIRSSLELSQILGAAVDNIRTILLADRVLIIRTLPNQHAETVAESVIPGLESLNNRCWLNFEIPEICIQEYLFGDFHFVDEVSVSRCNTCWIPNLTDDNIQSKIIAPINQTNDQGTYIWGVLLIQSHQKTPPWQQDDGTLTAKICQQLAIAIQQAELYESLQAANLELHAANQELEYLARNDGLTQVANRRSFDEHLANEWLRMEREQHPLGLIMCDIDFFKAYNDHYGHIAGDNCLREVAKVLQEAINRSGDLVARYGGEEFALILPNTDLWGAMAIAEKIQTAFATLQLPHAASEVAQYVTLSLGLAVAIPSPALSPEILVEQADSSLYQAKQTGRNRYCWLE